MNFATGISKVRACLNWGYFLKGSVFFVLYMLFGQVGLKFAQLEGFVSLLWLPTGLSLAAILVYGPSIWPFVGLGALVTTMIVGDSLLYTILVTTGNVLQALAGYWLLKRVGFDSQLERIRDVIFLVAMATLVPTTISAFAGSLGVTVTSDRPSILLFGNVFWLWWLGNAMGILVFTPFLLSIRREYFSGWPIARYVEWICLFLTLVISVLFVFTNVTGAGIYSYPLAYIPFPFLIWAAFRFGPPGAALASLTVGSMVAIGTYLRVGPFVIGSLQQQLLFLWTFVGLVAITSLILAAANSERERAQTRLQSSLEGARFGIWDWSSGDGTIQLDRNCARILGLDTFELEGTDAALAEFVKREDQATVAESIKDHLKGKIPFFEAEFRARRRDGEWIWLGARGRIIRRSVQGRPLRFMGTIQDVSDRKEDEIDLTKAKEVAEKANLEKSQFLASMSHEIRTPMNAMVGMTSLLLDTSLEGEQKDFVRSIRRNNETLLLIVNDILDFSRVEAGKLHLEAKEFDLKACIEEVLELNAVRIAKSGIKLRYTFGTRLSRFIVGDHHRLKEIVINLIDNALKHTEEGVVELTVKKPGENEIPFNVKPAKSQDWIGGVDSYLVQFSVRDTGVGIPADSLDTIFEPFSQVHSGESRNQGGTGLGLAISKRMAEKMGGSMWVESELGKGSTFQFVIRAKSAAGEMLPGDFAPIDEGETIFTNLAQDHPLEILLAEDNPENQEVARQLLLRFGYEVDVVNNGRKALEAIREKPYDIVFMDIQMPVLGGIETTRNIRRDVTDKNQPRIIVMTAVADSDNRTDCFAAGADDFVTKPVTPEKLRLALLQSA